MEDVSSEKSEAMPTDSAAASFLVAQIATEFRAHDTNAKSKFLTHNQYVADGRRQAIQSLLCA